MLETTDPILYYPSENPDEPIEKAIPVLYEHSDQPKSELSRDHRAPSVSSGGGFEQLSPECEGMGMFRPFLGWFRFTEPLSSADQYLTSWVAEENESPFSKPVEYGMLPEGT